MKIPNAVMKAVTSIRANLFSSGTKTFYGQLFSTLLQKYCLGKTMQNFSLECYSNTSKIAGVILLSYLSGRILPRYNSIRKVKYYFGNTAMKKFDKTEKFTFCITKHRQLPMKNNKYDQYSLKSSFITTAKIMSKE